MIKNLNKLILRNKSKFNFLKLLKFNCTTKVYKDDSKILPSLIFSSLLLADPKLVQPIKMQHHKMALNVS